MNTKNWDRAELALRNHPILCVHPCPSRRGCSSLDNTLDQEVGGLKEPKIHLLQLRFFTWTVSNFVLSLTVHAPKLRELKLKCVEPKALHFEVPSLYKLDLTIKKAGAVIKVDKFHNLRFLRIESLDLCSLAVVFAENTTIKQLEMEAYGSSHCLDIEEQHSVDLFSTFPNLVELLLGPRAWFILPESLRFSGIKIELTHTQTRFWVNSGELGVNSYKLGQTQTRSNSSEKQY
ncbi:hypothetical protein Cni_G06691 [Canna indica]|uniref:Uncharacterized protein n=1 Tax=Canna indica TaxID=4628 RepID=A0AAQ3JXG4_9LILI|nr:hypothetical protein Cni_G06691 [Canna indica]